MKQNKHNITWPQIINTIFGVDTLCNAIESYIDSKSNKRR